MPSTLLVDRIGALPQSNLTVIGNLSVTSLCLQESCRNSFTSTQSPGSDAINVTQSGNIGIGTTDPGSPLVVNDTGAQPKSFLGSEYGTMLLSQGTHAKLGLISLDLTDATDLVPLARISANDSSAGSYLVFGTTDSKASGINNNALTISPSGDIGIKTPPARTLDVGGTLRISGVDDSFTTAGWLRALELRNAGAIIWQKGTAAIIRFIGHTTDTKFYIGQTDKDDATGVPTYDLVVDKNSDVTIRNQLKAKELCIGADCKTGWQASSVTVVECGSFNGIPCQYVAYTDRAGTRYTYAATCPAGTKPISGGCSCGCKWAYSKSITTGWACGCCSGSAPTRIQAFCKAY